LHCFRNEERGKRVGEEGKQEEKRVSGYYSSEVKAIENLYRNSFAGILPPNNPNC